MSNILITESDKKEIAQKIFNDRVKSLHDNFLMPTIPALILCSTLVFLGLLELEDKMWVTLWYLSTLLLCAIRYGFVRWYKRDSQHLNRHLRIFIVGVALSGLMWGLAGTLLTPQHNVLHKVFIIIIIAGLDAGGCQTLKASRAANSLFVLTSILPFAIWTLFQKQPIYAYLSTSAFGFMVFMIFLAHKSYLQFIRSHRLFYENQFLAEKLAKSNTELNIEIAEHEKAKNRLDYLASHDYLTGIDNRLAFDEQFSDMLLMAKSEKYQFCVMYMDIDYFKLINDNYGHDVGDHVLVELAKKIMKLLRPQDVLARLGGDEFVILMGDENIEFFTEQFCQRARESFKTPLLINGRSIPVTLSMGASFYPQDGDSKMVLLKRADVALYQAKIMGRNCFAFYKEESKVLE